MSTSSTPYPYQIGQLLNFDVYATPVLGNNFENVTVLALLDPGSACQIIDIVGAHAAVYPYLQTAGLSVPNDPTQYNYIKIRTQSGEITALGMPWINNSTITATTNQVITATISGVTASDVQGVQNALIANGYTQIAVTITPLTTT
jgi:hypothetical protein